MKEGASLIYIHIYIYIERERETHTRNMRIGDNKNTLVKYYLETNDNFDFNDPKCQLIYIINNIERQLNLALFLIIIGVGFLSF